ncbi:MAG: hypothetical protein LKE27_02955 [Atopobiaceae bacterium]|jgi:hypothetical protein|nr:hypothetical protein [Atopobiaceae bacterium]
MKSIYFPDEEISKDDLLFVCYMIERVSRKLHQRNRYTVSRIGRKNLEHCLSVADVLHAENPEDVEDQWIADYGLEMGSFDISRVDLSLVERIPSALAMGKVYCRLILDTMQLDEDHADGIIRVYSSGICRTIDDYNASAYCEPSYVIARAYLNGGF